MLISKTIDQYRYKFKLKLNMFLMIKCLYYIPDPEPPKSSKNDDVTVICNVKTFQKSAKNQHVNMSAEN